MNQAINADDRTRAAMLEWKMKKVITRCSIITLLVIPLFLNVFLRAFSVYLDTDLLYLYNAPALEILYTVLYYVELFGTSLAQSAGYGILGYSVLRYGMRCSLVPIYLSLVSYAISFLSGTVETIYIYGISYVKANIDFLLPYWLINLFLTLFIQLCVIFLCAMVRTAFARHGRLRIGIMREDRKERRKNVLRRLYFYIFLLLLVFALISVTLDIFSFIREAGPPESAADWFFLIQSPVSTVLLSSIGLWVANRMGAYLTRKNGTLSHALQNT